MEAVAGIFAGVVTLGSFVRASECRGRAGVLTLGDAATGTGYIGIISTLLSWVAKVNSAFRTGSPASRLGVVVDGGFVNSVIMSVAVCFKKSSSLICRKGTVVGKM